MKKILYLVTQTEFGGAQKYVYDLATGLSENKYQIEIAVGRGKLENWLTDLKSKGFKVWQIKHLVRELNPWHDFLSAFELYSLFVRIKPDIIHLNSSKIGAIGAVVAWFYKKLCPVAKLYGVCHSKPLIIYTAHGFVFEEPLSIWRIKFYQWAERISSFCKDKIICVSEHDKITGLNNKIAPHYKFITIHNGINLEGLKFLSQDEARQKLIINHPFDFAQGRQSSIINHVVGTIANLYPTKGIRYLIRAAKNLVEKNPNLTFVIIGEGEQREWLEEKIKRLNLTHNIFLIGALKEAYQYLKAFDIYCLPSVKEGFPYTILEAMAAGLPIVATRVGGVVEIIEPEVNGLIVTAGKPPELGKAIQKLLLNEELRKKISQNNLEKVKKFSLEKMIRETEKVYEETTSTISTNR